MTELTNEQKQSILDNAGDATHYFINNGNYKDITYYKGFPSDGYGCYCFRRYSNEWSSGSTIPNKNLLLISDLKEEIMNEKETNGNILTDRQGREFQKGSLYMFYDDEKSEQFVGQLSDIVGSINEPYVAEQGYRYRHITTLPDNIEVGTIKEPPVKLEHGEWYLCEYLVAMGHLKEKVCEEVIQFTEHDGFEGSEDTEGFKVICKMVRDKSK